LDAPPLPLLDLPEPSLLRLVSSEGQTAVSFGDKVLFCFACDDVGMRNMAVVALTDAGVQGKQVAAAFGLSAEYVSILRGRARTDGSAGLVRRRGRPPKLTAGQVAKARGWAAEGVTQTEIARRLSVSRPVIGELLARLGPAPQQSALPDAPVDAETAGPGDAGPADGNGDHANEHGFRRSLPVPTGGSIAPRTFLLRRWRTARPPQCPPFVKISARHHLQRPRCRDWLRSQRVDPGAAASSRRLVPPGLSLQGDIEYRPDRPSPAPRSRCRP
jgi:DNA-binding CsgD family transcriptional regulator